MSLNQIVLGTWNNLMKKEDELFQKRIEICRHCKLYKVDKIFGEVCNSSLYLNPMTNELSPTPKPGFYHGCGCVLGSKCRVKDVSCPLNKW